MTTAARPMPAVPVKVVPQQKQEAAPLPPPVTRVDESKATLVLKVPADASVYLVDRKMNATGQERRFSIPVPEAGRAYTYPIRVEVVRNGKVLTGEVRQQIQGGQELVLTVAGSPDGGDMLALVAQR